MDIIDSHCHLERYLKNNSLNNVLAEADKYGVTQMIAVGTDTSDWGVYHDLAKKYPGKIYYTVGLHPCHVEEGWQDALQTLMPFFLNETQPVALGEIGLDTFHLPKDEAEAEKIYARQKQAFEKQLSFAYQLDCPVVVHSRGAFEDCVEFIDKSHVNWENVVFHCFAEGPEAVKVLNERGGRASFTGIITYKNAEEVRQALLAQGPERLMVETDAPYLAPTPHRGKENYPAYTLHVAEKAAELFDMPLSELAPKIKGNTVGFFRLPD